MPQIIPIKDLKNTSEVSELCHNAQEPIFITRNGYGDMVIMSMQTYERTLFFHDIHRKIARGEQSIEAGHVLDAFDSINGLRKKHGL